MLDEAACAAFVALYPDEIPDFRDLYARRRYARDPLPEHMVDAIVLAVAEGDDGRGLDEDLDDEPFNLADVDRGDSTEDAP